MSADQNLLFGLLALHNGFVSREQLVAAFGLWLLDKRRSIDAILLEQKHLDPASCELLRALTAKHLANHGNDFEKSLGAVGALPLLKSELEALADPDLCETLMQVPSKGESSVATAPAPFGMIAGNGACVPTSRFRILRPHAVGGLGHVSVALDKELNREVAFKEIRAEFADQPESRQRFVREAEITGALEHPSIVPVYGLGTYGNGRPYYAMRFIKGDSLKEWISQFHKKKAQIPSGEKCLALRQLLSRFIDVCQAMHYAHSRGVLHRDLKPHNVMLGKYGETLVVDWGLAKTLGEKQAEFSSETTRPVTPNSSGSNEVTTQGSAIGTPAYMSPEQAEGKIDELGPATDIYSLGVTLYHCLTGRVPFDQKSATEVLDAVRKGEFPKPREIDASIPRPLESICTKAMQRKASDRYATAQAIADDMEHYLADEPVTAHRESATELVTRFSRKHKSATMTAVVSLGAIIMLLSAGVFYARREQAKSMAMESMALEQFREITDDALDMLTRAKQNLGDDKKTLSDVERSFFENLLERWQAFSSFHSSQQRNQIVKAEAGNRIGHMMVILGRRDEGISKLDAARNTFESLSSKFPEDRRFQLELIAAHTGLGDAAGMGGSRKDATSSIKEYDKAIELIKKRLLIAPDDSEFQKKAISLQIRRNFAKVAESIE